MIKGGKQFQNFCFIKDCYEREIRNTILENQYLSKEKLNILLKEKYPNFKITIDKQ